MLMRQKPAVIDDICKTFHLSDSERTHLLTAGIGEGLLIMEDDHTEIKVISSPEEHRLITTNPDEMKKTTESKAKKIEKKKPKKKRKVEINVDENQRFFRKSKLNKHEVEYLLSKGYKISAHKSLASNKTEDFVLQPRHNESLNHLFTIFDICEYLEKKGIETQKFTTKKPDVTFTIGKKRYAIEVETGTVLEKAPNQLKEKVKTLNENYDEWFFIVTNRNKISSYRKFGDCVDLRYLKQRISKIPR